MKARSEETARPRMPLKILFRQARSIKDKILNRKAEKYIEDDDENIDLDALFDDIKKKKKERAEAERVAKENAANEKKHKRKFTEDGLPIYTEEELKMDNPKAGTTPLCPFDCDCCF